MGIKRPQNDQMKPIAMALGGGIIAAVATMFVPVSVLESITGATGLSELIPATAAPLGDTARALIAFGSGAVILVLLLAFALRHSDMLVSKDYAAPATAPTAAKSYGEIEAGTDRFSKLKERLTQIRLPQMPWAGRGVGGDDDILDLKDLPKLRSNDTHPDAPPRRPISVLNDLDGTNFVASKEPVASPSPVYEAPIAQATEEMSALPELECPVSAYEAIASAPDDRLAVSVDETPAIRHTASSQPSLAEMVAQMEAAVEQRKLQLQALEAAAAEMMASKSHSTTVVQQPDTASMLDPSLVDDDHAAERPPLEAVPSAPRTDQDDDMDAALSAALETLQRMNRVGG